MKEQILLEIVGTQRIDSQKDKIELTTVGELEETQDAYIIRYTEEQEPPLNRVKANVKIYKDKSVVEMTKSSPGNSCLIIEKSQRNLCKYATPYGDILMGISGHFIEGGLNEKNGSFTFGYDIDINGALASKNEVKLTFRKNREN